MMAADGRECAEGWGRTEEKGTKVREKQAGRERAQGGGSDWLCRPEGAPEGNAYWALLPFLLCGWRFQLHTAP